MRDCAKTSKPARRLLHTGWVLAAGSALLSACWATTEQASQISRRTDTLEQRTTALETGLGEEMRAEMSRAQTKVAELEDVLQRATQVVTRASADTGAQVEQLQQQIATQEGLIAELRHEMSQLQASFRQQQDDYENRMKLLSRRAGIDMPLEDSEIPADRDAHYQAAVRAYEAREFSMARALYRAYVTRYATDARADDAQLAIGRSYLQEDRPSNALGELRVVITDFQQGDAVPGALFEMAEAFYRLHACTDARSALDALIRAHPRSTLVAPAREKLRTINAAPRGYCES